MVKYKRLEEASNAKFQISIKLGLSYTEYIQIQKTNICKLCNYPLKLLFCYCSCSIATAMPVIIEMNNLITNVLFGNLTQRVNFQLMQLQL